MKNLIEAVRQDYEYIIIDLPPVLPLADVRGAAHLIDSFILVVKWGQTTIDDVKNALAHIIDCIRAAARRRSEQCGHENHAPFRRVWPWL